MLRTRVLFAVFLVLGLAPCLARGWVVSSTLTASQGTISATSAAEDGSLCPAGETCAFRWVVRPDAWAPGSVVQLTITQYIPGISVALESSRVLVHDGDGDMSPQLCSFGTEMVSMFEPKDVVSSGGALFISFEFPNVAEDAGALFMASWVTIEDRTCPQGVLVLRENSGSGVLLAMEQTARTYCYALVNPEGWNESTSILLWLHGITADTVSISVYNATISYWNRLVKQYKGETIGNVITPSPNVYIYAYANSQNKFDARQLRLTWELIPRREPNCAALGWCNGHGTCVGDGNCACQSGYEATANCASYCSTPCVHGTCVGSSCVCVHGWRGEACDQGQTCPGADGNYLTDDAGGFQLSVNNSTDSFSCTVFISPASWTADQDIVISWQAQTTTSSAFMISVGDFISDKSSFAAALEGSSLVHAAVATVEFSLTEIGSSINVSWTLQKHVGCDGITVVSDPHGGSVSFGSASDSHYYCGYLLRPEDAPPLSRLEVEVESVPNSRYVNIIDAVSLEHRLQVSAPNTGSVTLEHASGLLWVPSVNEGMSPWFAVNYTVNDIDFDCSSHNDCSGNGDTCTASGECVCKTGFWGDDCSLHSDCSGHGHWTTYSGCICDDGWIGLNCSISSPCPSAGFVVTDTNASIFMSTNISDTFSCSWLIMPKPANGTITSFMSLRCSSSYCPMATVWRGTRRSTSKIYSLQTNGQWGTAGPISTTDVPSWEVTATFSGPSVFEILLSSEPLGNPDLDTEDCASESAITLHDESGAFGIDASSLSASTTSAKPCRWLVAPFLDSFASFSITLRFDQLSAGASVSILDGSTPLGVSVSNGTEVTHEGPALFVLLDRANSVLPVEMRVSYTTSVDSICACKHCLQTANCSACRTGWTGDDCSEFHCPSGCMHGTCVGPSLCKCDEGFSGYNCDVSIEEVCGALVRNESSGIIMPSGVFSSPSTNCIVRLEPTNWTSASGQAMRITVEFVGSMLRKADLIEILQGDDSLVPLFTSERSRNFEDMVPVYALRSPVILRYSVMNIMSLRISWSLVPVAEVPFVTCHGVQLLEGSEGSIYASKRHFLQPCSWVISAGGAASSVSGLWLKFSKHDVGTFSVFEGKAVLDSKLLGSWRAGTYSAEQVVVFVPNSTVAFLEWSSTSSGFLSFEWSSVSELSPSSSSSDASSEGIESSSPCPFCEHGVCLKNGKCVCLEGWSGGNCTVPSCSYLPANSVCVGPNEFACTNGMADVSCSVPSPCDLLPAIFSNETGSATFAVPTGDAADAFNCVWQIRPNITASQRLRLTLTIFPSLFNEIKVIDIATGTSLLFYDGSRRQTVVSGGDALNVTLNFVRYIGAFTLDWVVLAPEDDPCSLRGVMLGDSHCLCDLGWMGPRCSIPECGVTSEESPFCSFHGFCPNGTTNCVCDDGWFGTYCSYQVPCPPFTPITADSGVVDVFYGRYLYSGGYYTTGVCTWNVTLPSWTSDKAVRIDISYLESASQSAYFYSADGFSQYVYQRSTTSQLFIETGEFSFRYMPEGQASKGGISFSYALVDRIMGNCSALNDCSNRGVCTSDDTCVCFSGSSGADCGSFTCYHGFMANGTCACFDGWGGIWCNDRVEPTTSRLVAAQSDSISFTSISTTFNTRSWKLQPSFQPEGSELAIWVDVVFGNSSLLSISDGAFVEASFDHNSELSKNALVSSTGFFQVSISADASGEGFLLHYCARNVLSGECILEIPRFGDSSSSLPTESSNAAASNSAPEPKNTLKLVLAIALPVCALIIAGIVITLAVIAVRRRRQALTDIELSDLNRLVVPSPLMVDFSEGHQCKVGERLVRRVTVANATGKRFEIEFRPLQNPFKWEIVCSPSTPTLEPNGSVEIECALKVLCTTTLKNVPVDIMVRGQEVGRFFIQAEAGLSPMLDRDEITLGTVLGSGSFASVYTGTWRSTEVAVKVFRVEMLDLRELSSEIRREVEICINLRHPNIVTYIGSAVSSDSACIVMEMVPNGSLTKAINARTLGDSSKLRIALDVASGMSFLHASHIIHRDLKPDNVLLVSLDVNSPICAKITDFGSSRSIASESAKTITKGVGSPVYCAPEVLDGKNTYGFSADVYSFGLLLWHLFANSVPFAEVDSNFAILRLVLDGKRPPMTDSVPEDIRDVIASSWAHDPAARPTFEVLVERIEAAMSARGLLTERSTSRKSRAVRR